MGRRGRSGCGRVSAEHAGTLAVAADCGVSGQGFSAHFADSRLACFLGGHAPGLMVAQDAGSTPVKRTSGASWGEGGLVSGVCGKTGILHATVLAWPHNWALQTLCGVESGGSWQPCRPLEGASTPQTAASRGCGLPRPWEPERCVAAARRLDPCSPQVCAAAQVWLLFAWALPDQLWPQLLPV